MKMRNFKMNFFVIVVTFCGISLSANNNGKDEPHYQSGHEIVNPNNDNSTRDVVQVTFSVDMSGNTISSDGIYIGGDWNGWDPGATQLSHDGDSVYSVTIALNSGTHYQYKFFNNDWEYIYENECANASNGDRWLNVPTTENYELPTYCFNSCAPCRGSEILIINNSNNYYDENIVEQYLNDSFDEYDYYYLDTKHLYNTSIPSVEFLNYFDMIYEFHGNYPWSNFTDQTRQWYEEGNKKYIISGQDYLWMMNGQMGDTYYAEGSYQYDILGLTGAYQELYDNCCNGMHRMRAIDGNFLSDPLYDHLADNDLYLNYAPTNEQGHSNYADGLYLREDAVSVMEIFQGDIWSESDPDPGTTLYSGGVYYESYNSEVIFFPINPVALNANNDDGTNYEQIGQSDLSPLILAFNELFGSYDMDVTFSSHELLLDDTVAVGVHVDILSDTSYFAFQGTFSGSDSDLEFIGFDTIGTLMGSANWYYTFNVSNDSSEVVFAATGEDNISSDGVLINMLFRAKAVTDIPASVDLYYAVFNADLVPSVHSGNITILPKTYGDVDLNGLIQAYDAALVLQHLVDYITLSDIELQLADVTLDTSVSALDASVILQYVVSLIDTLPYDDAMGMIAGGEPTMNNYEVEADQSFALPIILSNAENILSFEGFIEYDPSKVQIEELEWHEAFSNFFMEEDVSEGSIRFVGAGVSRVDAVDYLVNIHLTTLNDLTETTEIVLKDFRLNENNIIDIAAVSEISLSALSIDDYQIPSKFILNNNYPNPFNPETTISFDIPEELFVTLTIFDVSGKKVNVLQAGTLNAGSYRLRWDGKDSRGQVVSAGMYLYHIDAGVYSDTKKLIFLK